MGSCGLICESDSALLDQPSYQAEQQGTEQIDPTPTDLVGCEDAGRSDQELFIDFQHFVTQAQVTTTSRAPSPPAQPPGAPDTAVLKDFRTNVGTAPEGESSQNYGQYHFTAQNPRTIEMVTIDQVQIQHFFTV